MLFGLIGAGKISERHVTAIKSIGGTVARVSDPALRGCETLDAKFFDGLDWVSICSPTYCHYGHVQTALKYPVGIICEKPYVLPWQPILMSGRVHVVLQTRWLDLPPTAKVIRVKAARNDAYFNSWKGDPLMTGGLFFDLFIHYVDMARRYNCELRIEVVKEGTQERWIDDFDLMKVDMQDAYCRMYRDVVFGGKRVSPEYVAEIHWLLARYTERHGFGREIMGKIIRISPNGLVHSI